MGQFDNSGIDVNEDLLNDLMGVTANPVTPIPTPTQGVEVNTNLFNDLMAVSPNEDLLADLMSVGTTPTTQQEGNQDWSVQEESASDPTLRFEGPQPRQSTDLEAVGGAVRESLKSGARTGLQIPSMVAGGVAATQDFFLNSPQEAYENNQELADAQQTGHNTSMARQEHEAMLARGQRQIDEAIANGLPEEYIDRIRATVARQAQAGASGENYGQRVQAQQAREEGLLSANLDNTRATAEQLHQDAGYVAEEFGLAPEEYRRLEGFGGFGQDVAAGVADLGVMMALGAVHPSLAGAYITGKSTGGTYETMLDDGIAPEDAFTAVAISAPVIVALEKAGLENVGANILRRGLGQAVAKKFGPRVVSGMLAEGFTEALQTYPEVYAEIWASNEGLPEEERVAYSFEQFLDATKDALYSGAVGSVVGGGGAGFDVAAGRVRDNRVARIEQARRDAVLQGYDIPADAVIEITSTFDETPVVSQETTETAVESDGVVATDQETMTDTPVGTGVTTDTEVVAEEEVAPEDRISTDEEKSTLGWQPTQADILTLAEEAKATIAAREEDTTTDTEQVAEETPTVEQEEVVEEATPVEPVQEIQTEENIDEVVEEVPAQDEQDDAPVVDDAEIEEDIEEDVEEDVEEVQNNGLTVTEQARRAELNVDQRETQGKIDNLVALRDTPASPGSKLTKGLSTSQTKALNINKRKLTNINTELNVLKAKATEASKGNSQDLYVEEGRGYFKDSPSASTAQGIDLLPTVFAGVPVENVVGAMDNKYSAEQVTEALGDLSVNSDVVKDIRTTWGLPLTGSSGDQAKKIATRLREDLISNPLDEAGPTQTFDDTMDRDDGGDASFDFGANVEQEVAVTEDTTSESVVTDRVRSIEEDFNKTAKERTVVDNGNYITSVQGTLENRRALDKELENKSNTELIEIYNELGVGAAAEYVKGKIDNNYSYDGDGVDLVSVADARMIDSGKYRGGEDIDTPTSDTETEQQTPEVDNVVDSVVEEMLSDDSSTEIEMLEQSELDAIADMFGLSAVTAGAKLDSGMIVIAIQATDGSNLLNIYDPSKKQKGTITAFGDEISLSEKQEILKKFDIIEDVRKESQQPKLDEISGYISTMADNFGISNVKVAFREDAEQYLRDHMGYDGFGLAIAKRSLVNVRGVAYSSSSHDKKLISLNSSLNDSDMVKIAGHELGHLIQQEYYENASQEVKDAIQSEFDSFLMENKKSENIEDLYRARGAGVINIFEDSNDIAYDNLTNSQKEYLESFDEWFADNVSRWIATNKKPTNVVEQFFKDVADKFKELVTGLKKSYPTVNFDNFINEIYKSNSSVESGKNVEFFTSKPQKSNSSEAVASIETTNTVLKGTKKKNKAQAEKVQKLSTQWLNRLGINVGVTTSDFGAVIDSGVDVNDKTGLGLKASLGGGGYLIALTDRVMADDALTVAVTSHETGHIVIDEMYSKSSDKVQKALWDAYRGWLAEQQKNGTPLNELLYNRVVPFARDILRDENPAIKFGDIDSEFTSFNEWLADGIGKAILANETQQGVVGKFFADVAAKLKQLFKLSKLETLKADEVIESWVIDMMDAAKRNSKQSETNQTVGYKNNVSNVEMMQSYIHNHKSPVAVQNLMAWIGQTHIVDEDGDPLVVYHGTTHVFNEFDATQGNIESAVGLGNYFSNSISDVNTNYAKLDGVDLTARISQRSEEIMDMEIDDIVDAFGVTEEVAESISEDSDKAEAIARKELVGEAGGGAVMPTYLRMTNPVYLSARGDNQVTTFHSEYDEDAIRADAESNLDRDDYDNDEDYETDLEYAMDELRYEPEYQIGDFERLRETIANVADDYFDYGPDSQELANELLMDEYEITAKELYTNIQENSDILDGVDYQGERTTNGEFTRRLFEAMGFDGTVMSAPEFFPRMDNVEDSYHFITFSADQQKSATGNNGDFDPQIMSIEYLASGEQPKVTTVDDGNKAAEKSKEKIAEGDLLGATSTFQEISTAIQQSVSGVTGLDIAGLDQLIKNTNEITESFLKQIDESVTEQETIFSTVTESEIVEAEKRGVQKERERAKESAKRSKELVKEKTNTLKEFIESLDLKADDKRKAMDSVRSYANTRGVDGAIKEVQRRFGELKGRNSSLKLWKLLLRTHLADLGLTGTDYLRAKEILRKQTEGTNKEFLTLVEEIYAIADRRNTIVSYTYSMIDMITESDIKGTQKLRTIKMVRDINTDNQATLDKVEKIILNRAALASRKLATDRLNNLIKKVPDKFMSGVDSVTTSSLDPNGKVVSSSGSIKLAVEDIVNTLTGTGMSEQNKIQYGNLQTLIDNGQVQQSDLGSRTLKELQRAIKVLNTSRLSTDDINAVADRLQSLLEINKLKTEIFKRVKTARRREIRNKVVEDVANNKRYRAGLKIMQKLTQTGLRGKLSATKARVALKNLFHKGTMTDNKATSVVTVLERVSSKIGSDLENVIYGFSNKGKTSEISSDYVFELVAQDIIATLGTEGLRGASTLGYDYGTVTTKITNTLKSLKDGLYESVTLPSGAVLEDVTPGELISMYLLNKNKDQLKALTQSIGKGGVVQSHHRDNDAKIKVLTEEDVAFAIAHLKSLNDGAYIEAADMMGDFINTYVKLMGNQTSNAIDGMDIFDVDNYWRISRTNIHKKLFSEEKSSGFTDFREQIGASLEGASLFKARVDNAAGTLVIEDAFETFTQIFQAVNKYNSYAVGLRQAKDTINDIEGLMKSSNQKDDWNYLNDWVNGFEKNIDSRSQDAVEKTISWVRSNVVKAKLAYGVFVQGKQWASLQMAATEGLKRGQLYANLAKVLLPGGKKSVKKALELAKQHSPQLYARMTGKSSTHLLVGRSMKSQMQDLWGMDFDGFSDKGLFAIPEEGMKKLRNRDAEVVAAIYYTCLTASKGDVATAWAEAERIVNRTQPVTEYKDRDMYATESMGNPYKALMYTFSGPTRQYYDQLQRKWGQALVSKDFGKFLGFLVEWLFVGSVMMTLLDSIRDLFQDRDITVRNTIKRLISYGMSPFTLARFLNPGIESFVVDPILDKVMGPEDENLGFNSGDVAQPWNSGIVPMSVMAVFKDVEMLRNEIKQEKGIPSEYDYNDDMFSAGRDLAAELSEVTTGFGTKKGITWFENVVNAKSKIDNFRAGPRGELFNFDAVRARRMMRLSNEEVYPRRLRNSAENIEKGYSEYYIPNTDEWRERLEAVDANVQIIYADDMLLEELIRGLYENEDVAEDAVDAGYENLSRSDRRRLLQAAYRSARNTVDGEYRAYDDIYEIEEQ